MIRFVERIAFRPGGTEWIHGKGIGEGAAARTCGRARRLLDQPHLDFVGAKAQPVAVTQAAHVAAADRVAFPVEEGAVGRGVGELPSPGAERHGKVALGEQPLGIGQHPIDARSTPDGEFAAGDVAGLGCHRVRAAQNRHCQLHSVSRIAGRPPVRRVMPFRQAAGRGRPTAILRPLSRNRRNLSSLRVTSPRTEASATVPAAAVPARCAAGGRRVAPPATSNRRSRTQRSRPRPRANPCRRLRAIPAIRHEWSVCWRTQSSATARTTESAAGGSAGAVSPAHSHAHHTASRLGIACATSRSLRSGTGSHPAGRARR